MGLLSRPAMVAYLIVLSGWNDAVHARINVVTLPARDTVQLTIYNSVELRCDGELRRQHHALNVPGGTVQARISLMAVP